MTKFKERRCRECGKGIVRPVTGSGRKRLYKTLNVAVPADVVIPTCDHCGAEWHTDATARKLDEALDKGYRAELRRRVIAMIDALMEHVSQRKLEQVLGLSAGYISKVRVGDREPSAELVSELALVARDPEARVKELETFWANGAA